MCQVRVRTVLRAVLSVPLQAWLLGYLFLITIHANAQSPVRKGHWQRARRGSPVFYTVPDHESYNRLNQKSPEKEKANGVSPPWPLTRNSLIGLSGQPCFFLLLCHQPYPAASATSQAQATEMGDGPGSTRDDGFFFPRRIVPPPAIAMS